MPTNTNDYDRAYYAANKEKRRSQIRERNKEHIKRNREWLRAWYEDKECSDCGISDWRVLQLDHQRDKKINVADILRSSYSLKKLQDEVAKCEVVCANCHSIRTGEAFGFWRFTQPD